MKSFRTSIKFFSTPKNKRNYTANRLSLRGHQKQICLYVFFVLIINQIISRCSFYHVAPFYINNKIFPTVFIFTDDLNFVFCAFSVCFQATIMGNPFSVWCDSIHGHHDLVQDTCNVSARDWFQMV